MYRGGAFAVSVWSRSCKYDRIADHYAHPTAFQINSAANSKITLRFYCGFPPLVSFLADKVTKRGQAFADGVRQVRSGGNGISVRLIWLLLASGALCMCCAATANASEPVYDIDIPAQNAAKALDELASQTDAITLYPFDLLSTTQANEVVGRYTLQEALDVLLKDTGLESGLSEKRVISILPATVDDHTDEEEPMQIKKSSLLAGLVTVVIGSGANAQDAGGSAQLEEIVVIGIRAGLESASIAKRDSNVIQDSIRSEDIGRFPDSNVAESLQRIPGVSIDRTSGEGQRVTVRGFGPDFNTVLLNGRRIASSSIAGVGGAADDNIGSSLSNRGFNFDIISADLIGGADVYKTATVGLQDGGIGSTINLQTLRPLQMRDESMLFTAKVTQNDVGGDTSPSVFGFINRKFMNDRVGFVASVSYQDRKLRRETMAENGFIPTTVTAGQTTGIGPGVGGVAGLYYVPQQVALTVNEQQRERLGLTGTLEFKASESVTVTFDTIYSKLDVDSDVDTLANFYFINGSNLEDVTLDSNNTLVSFNNTSRQLAYNGRAYTRPTALLALGGNIAWDVNDNLSLDFDVAFSDAEDTSHENGGGGRFAVIREPGNLRYDVSSGTPAISTDAGFGANPNALTTFVLGKYGEGVDDKISEFKLSGTYDFGDSGLTEIRFGSQFSQEERFNTVVEQAGGIGFYAFPGGSRVAAPGSLVSVPSTGGILSGASGIQLPGNYVSYSIDSLLAYLGTDPAFADRDAGLGLAPGTSAAEFAARGGFDATLFPATSFGVDEDILALYAEAQFDGEFGSQPWTVNVGVRYVETDTAASGFQDSITDIRALVPGDTAYIIERVIGEPVSASSSYDNFLPSVNGRFNLSDNVILRAAYSETLSRPVLTDLAPRIAFGSSVRPGNFVVNAGNPNLQPFESENLDLSLEWYYSPGSYLSAAAFKKDVSGFVVTQDFTETFTIANVDGITTEPNINGNAVTFTVRRPNNTSKATIDGFELSWQHTFESGFGVQANATFVDSDAVLDASDPSADSNSALLPGLGDSRNLVVFYENDKFGARLAYNVRDQFLRAAATGPGSEPAFVEDYDQLDFRVMYNLNDMIEVFVDGTNITSEVIRQHGRFANHFLLAEETGARYSLGVRARF